MRSPSGCWIAPIVHDLSHGYRHAAHFGMAARGMLHGRAEAVVETVKDYYMIIGVAGFILALILILIISRVIKKRDETSGGRK